MSREDYFSRGNQHTRKKDVKYFETQDLEVDKDWLQPCHWDWFLAVPLYGHGYSKDPCQMNCPYEYGLQKQ